MDKMTCKQILQVIDDLEIEGLSLDDLRDELQSKMPSFHKDIADLLTQLTKLHLLKQGGNIIDLVPCAAIFIRSHHGSLLEALALFEFTLLLPKNRELFYPLCETNDEMSLEEWEICLGSFMFDLLKQTCFFEIHHRNASINSLLLEDMKLMIEEYDHDDILLSTVLLAKYCHHLIFEKANHLEMRNTDLQMIDYPMLETIMAILPKRGIPKDRDITRGLQAFYKDTLFHEFNHHCPICGAAIPQLLIASHIRPFRDCTHVYETIDYHNGILLCKNHDFLFDQGYFSFLEDGHIIFSEALLQYDLSHYQLDPDYTLPEQYLTKTRKQFLAYHLNHVFQKH